MTVVKKLLVGCIIAIALAGCQGKNTAPEAPGISPDETNTVAVIDTLHYTFNDNPEKVRVMPSPIDVYNINNDIETY